HRRALQFGGGLYRDVGKGQQSVNAAMNRTVLFSLLALLAMPFGFSACNGSSDSRNTPPVNGTPAATQRASCGPGSRPEIGIQGRVSRAEYDSGRAAEGYTCNTELVGSYTVPNANGTVGGFKVERYVDAAGHDCAYYDT